MNEYFLTFKSETMNILDSYLNECETNKKHHHHTAAKLICNNLLQDAKLSAQENAFRTVKIHQLQNENRKEYLASFLWD